MYRLLFPVLFFWITSCSTSDKPAEKNQHNSTAKAEKGNSADSVIIAKDFEEQTPTRRIDSLLMNPFDLNTYKRKKRGANSSRENRKDFYFKPDTSGIYYAYFLFNLTEEQKYIGKDVHNPSGIGRNSGGREIKVFKPDDADQNMYNDPNETLIEFTQWCNDVDLPELAFVGWTEAEIKEYFGKPDFLKSGSLVYTFNDRVLLFHIRGGRVDWLKYAHINGQLTDSPIFEKLYERDIFGM